MYFARLIHVLVWSTGLAGSLFSPPTIAGPSAVDIEYKLKAVFLLNFARFVEWPVQAFSDDKAPITICVVGEDPFGRILDEAVKGEKVRDRALAIKRLSLQQDPHTCHIAFFSRSTVSQPANALLGLRGSYTLTVGEMEDGFFQQGGVINFVLVDQKVRFEVNTADAVQTNLKISSKLLALSYKR
jgi:hypothetical protein